MDERELPPLQSSYFTLQALRAGYLKPGDLDSGSRRDLREAILKEIGRERVREEILAAEIAELRRGTAISFPTVPSSSPAAVPRIRFPASEERIGERLVEERHGLLPFHGPSFDMRRV